SVYARGTYQNVPAVGTHLYTGTPGRYLYTARLPGLERGTYRLIVTAADVCGNTGSLSIPITVVEPTGPPPAPPAPPPPDWPAFAASARYPGAYPRLIVPRPQPPVVRRTEVKQPAPRRPEAKRQRGPYAVIAASVPESDGYAAARAEAKRALAAGLVRARVVH